MRKSAGNLDWSEFVAPCGHHQIGVALCKGVGASPKVNMHGVGAPAAEDLYNVFVHSSAE